MSSSGRPAGASGPGPVDADARFRLLFERSADAILLLDTGINKFVEYNAATLEMLRCTREELAALHPSELSPPLQPDGGDSFTRANEMIATAIARGSHRFEWIHRSPNRPDFPVEVLLTPIDGGAAPTLMVVWRDITARKRDEEVLRKSQKLESLGVLAGGIAHDFNNLLAAIAAHLDLARRSPSVDAAVRGNLDHASAAVRKAAHLTRQMLAYSGKGAFVVGPVELGGLVREISALLAVSAPKGVRVVHALAADLPTVVGDAAQLEQVILNLVTNAAEAIPAGEGTVTVRTGTAVLDEETVAREYAGQALPPGPCVFLEVEDTGVGMAPEVVARIFDPFFSTKQSGRGLGLSALQGIVRAHQGGIRIRSAPGRGTTFRVAFPAAPAPAQRPEPRPELPSARGGGTILLVEDEPTVRRGSQLLLELIGFTVLEAADGAEALEVFAAHRSDIGLVLMDLTMPRMDGRAALAELRRLDPTVKVILTSGWADSDRALPADDHPSTGFLAKPFSLDELTAALRAAGLLT